MDPCKSCITKPGKDECKKKCVRKQNLLVYDKSNPCVDKTSIPKSCYRVIPLKSANIKKIKVCTGADLKRMCPPKLCECPTKKLRNTGLMATMGRMLGFGVKGALAGGLVYWTYEIGLWGKPDETEQLYIDLCKFIRQPNKDEMERLFSEARDRQKAFSESCDTFKKRQQQLAVDESVNKNAITEDQILAQMNICQQAPSIRENANCFKNCWNRFVVWSFALIMNLPSKLRSVKEAIEGRKSKSECDTDDEDSAKT